MDFPIKNGGSFHCYVSSPEGKPPFSYGFPMVFPTPSVSPPETLGALGAQTAGRLGCAALKRGSCQVPQWNGRFVGIICIEYGFIRVYIVFSWFFYIHIHIFIYVYIYIICVYIAVPWSRNGLWGPWSCIRNGNPNSINPYEDRFMTIPDHVGNIWSNLWRLTILQYIIIYLKDILLWAIHSHHTQHKNMDKQT